jgi:hypothetical protein
VTLPRDHLPAIWRGNPNGTGIGVIALDPREAAYVLEHGCTIDGERWTASRGGFQPTAQQDGRVVLRLTKQELEIKDWPGETVR